MQYLMQINHMVLLYLAAIMASLLVALAIIFVKLRQQMKETQALTLKLDRVINEVLSVGSHSDFTVRSKKF